MAVIANSGQEPTLSDYARAVLQRKWIVILVAVAVTALAFGYTFLQTPLYEASAELLYENQLNVADPLSTHYTDAAQRQTELANVGSVIASPDLAKSAREILRAEGSVSTGFTVETVSGAESTSAADQSETSTVSIRAVSPDAQTAARAANAYAQAFTEFRKEREQARVRDALQVVRSSMDRFTSAQSRETVEYLTLQQRLQDLQILEATVTGNFTILAPAAAPDAPFTPRPVRNGLMGLTAGLVFGIMSALTVAQFDTRVRSQDEAVALLGMPLWGQIRKMPPGTVDREPLVVLDEAHNQAAEAFRKLRGSLEFASVDQPVKSLFLTSTLQHEGKSVTASNLALALAEAGNRVVLVDGDLRRPQAHKHFDLPNTVGVSTVLTGRTKLDVALWSRRVGRGFARVEGAGASLNEDRSLSVLTSGPIPPNPAELIASRSFAALIERLEGEFDTVIVDAPALLAVGDTAAIARCVDGMLFLVDLTRAKRPLLQEAANQISLMPCRKLGLVVIVKALRRNGYEHYRYDSPGPAAPIVTEPSAGEERTKVKARRG